MLNRTSTRFWLKIFFRIILVINIFFGFFSKTPQPVYAAAGLTITPITWNIVGLDSNNPATGPNEFPVGVKVCNISALPLTVSSAFYWDSSDPYINLRPGSKTSYTGADAINLAAGNCTDFYYEVEITRTSAAYNHTRRYHITASATGVDTVSTPIPREIYIEKLVSQNRNTTDHISYAAGINPSSYTDVYSGGTMTLQVGNTYTIKLYGGTATGGYNQLEEFVSLPNTLFQIISAKSDYAVDTSPYVTNPNPSLYGDGCLWDNDPTSPSYRSCTGADGKIGGNSVVTTYVVKILSSSGSTMMLNTLIYDFSGSSFHYNADFETSGIFVEVTDPAFDLLFSKSFSPAAITAGSTSILNFTITNPTAVDVTGVNFTDTLPTTPGAMTTSIAGAADYSTTNCGSPSFTPADNAALLEFSEGTIAAGATCVVTVKVKVPANPTSGTYTNVSGPLMVGFTNTRHTANASLTLSKSGTGGLTCITRSTLASWNFPTGFNTSSPVPTTKYTGLGTISVQLSSLTGAASSATDSNPPSDGTLAWITSGYSNSKTYDPNRNIVFGVPQLASNYDDIAISFDYKLGSSWPVTAQIYVDSSINGTTYTNLSTTTIPDVIYHSTGQKMAAATATGSGTTYFRISTFDAPNTSGQLFIDNVSITACTEYGSPHPPILTKSFSPTTVPVNGAASTLTFEIENTNGSSLTGVEFDDNLPQGLVIGNTVTTPASTTCTAGTISASTDGSLITFRSGEVQPGKCVVTVPVIATLAGIHINSSGYITSTEGGTNTTSSGFGTATLTGLLPPTISKEFTSPILSGGTSTLSFYITNPNPNDALTGVTFTDNFPTTPGNMVIAPTPGATYSDGSIDARINCGSGSIASPIAGANSITFSGGTIPADGLCIVTINVTAPTVGTYTNSTGNVSSTNGGTGTSASADMQVNQAIPAINLLKQISTSASGPWYSFLTVSADPPLYYYRFVVENTGNVPLNNIGVNDPLISTSSCSFASPLAAGSTTECVLGPRSASSTLGTYPNTAKARGSYLTTFYESSPSTAIYALPAPDLSLTKINNVSGSVTGTSSSFSWSLLVKNSRYGNPATFDSGKVILKDYLPSGPTYNTTVSVNSGPVAPTGTGTIACSISTNVLTCLAQGGTVVLDADASFTAIVSVTQVNISGDLVNPTGGVCQVDPDDTIQESNETNNVASDTVTVNVPDTADLRLVKTNSTSGSGLVGTPFTWNLTISNTGTADAEFTVGQTILTDDLPSDISYGTVVAGGFSGITNSANISCNISVDPGALTCSASGGSVTITQGGNFTVGFSVTPSKTGTFTNTATVDPGGLIFESNESNNTGSNAVTVEAYSDLEVTKTDGVTSINGTGTATTTYTIRVTNNGPSTVAGAVLKDTIGTGVSATSVACTGTSGNTCGAELNLSNLTGVGGIILPTLINGAIYEFSLDANVTALSGSVANTINITPPAGTIDPDSSNDSATDTDTINPVSNLVVTKTDGKDSIIANGSISTTYTIKVTNNGPSAVIGVVLKDTLGSGLTATGVACTGTSSNTCGVELNLSNLTGSSGITLPALALNAFYEFTLSANITATSGDVTNSATVTLPSGTSDPTPTDNTATDTTSIIAGSTTLTIEKTSTTTEITAAGQSVPYKFTVTNDGNVTITGLSITDSKCSNAITPTPSSISVGESKEFTCNHTVNQAEMIAGGVLSNTVIVDSNETNEVSDTFDIDIVQSPELTVTETSTTESISKVGDVVPYTFTVENTGTKALTEITVTATKCANSDISLTPSSATADAIMQVGEVWVYTCNYQVIQSDLDASNALLPNMVTADSKESAAAQDTLTIFITQTPGLTLTKTAEEASFSNVGDTLHYTLTAKNTGNVGLTDVSISDALLGTLDCTPTQPTSLVPDESLVCTGTHTVDSIDLAAGYYKNTAYATGKPPVGDTRTPEVDLTTNAASKLGLAKELVSVTKVEGVAGTWDVQIKFYVRNYENIAISALQITDNLNSAFPSPAQLLSVNLSNTTLDVNSGFNGSTDINLLTGEDVLAGNGSASLTMTIRLVPAKGEYANTAMVSGEDPDGKTVGDISQSGSNPDPDETGAPGDHSSPTMITFNGNIFDPPYGTKVYDDSGLPAILWTMEWINDSNVLAIDAEVLDPIPSGSTFLETGVSNGYPFPPGNSTLFTDIGVACTDTSSLTSTKFCYFEKPTSSYPQGRIIWKGTIGPDLGETNPAIAVNDLKIEYYLTIDSDVEGINNIASINVDLNGDGVINSGSETNVEEASSIWGTIIDPQTPSNAATSIVTSKLPGTGFIPNTITLLPKQPDYLHYKTMSELTLEIPKLKLNAEIVGVPFNDSTGEWDVTWLSTQLGWLNGTAFPSGEGNSLITGHVYLPSGLPGPFKDLGTLKWGDLIILHDQGRRFVYEVREVKSVLPSSQSAFKHEDRAWLTLITCEGYDEETDTYVFRKLVRAVLVSVSDD